MWRRYHNRSYYRKDGDLVEGILGLYVMWLVFLWFTDRVGFWKWLSYGFTLLIVFLAGFYFFNKVKNKRGNISYLKNQELINYSQAGHKSTPEARKLGEYISKFGWNVESEKWDGHKHIDLAITKAKVNIEVDGRQHSLSPAQALRDQMRDYYSSKKGFETIRIPNSLLRDDDGIKQQAELLNKRLEDRIRRLGQ